MKKHQHYGWQLQHRAYTNWYQQDLVVWVDQHQALIEETEELASTITDREVGPRQNHQ